MFRFGADYYPEHWPEERWAVDAGLMQEAGFNTVRLAEFAWSRLEPSPGEFDFDWLDRSISVLAKHDIQVVLGTPTASPPPWVMDTYPDAFLQKQDGHVSTYGNRREYCPTHPGYRERSRIVSEAMARHYVSNPTVIGWQTDNEFGSRCFCPICRRSFQAWLQEKYGTLDALNEAWGTIFWSHVYTEWSQIPVPVDTSGRGPAGSPNPGLGLDYYRFMSDTYVRFQDEQLEILRQWCPQHFVTHNLMGFNYDLINYFDLSADLDFVTWDNYQRMQWTLGVPIVPSWPALGHDTMRGLKGKNFWVMEQQSGSGGWDTVGEAVRPGELSLWAYQAIAHGADGMIFFRWRTARFGTEQYWHGILDHHGIPGRRYEEVKTMGQQLAKIGDQIEGSKVEAEVGMMLSYDSRFAFQIQPNNPGFDYRVHFNNVYSAFYRNNVAVDIIRPDADLSGYKLVIVPAMYVLDDTVAASIAAHVKAGGMLVVTARSGVKDESNNVVNMKLPGLLAEVCGVEVEEYDSLPLGSSQPLKFSDDSLDPAAAALAGAWCDVLEPTTADVIATYTQEYYAGRAAVTANRYGEGTAYYVATFGNGALYQALAARWCSTAQIDTMALDVADVEIARRRQGDQEIWFVLNHSAEERQIDLRDGLVDLLDGAQCSGKEMTLPPRGVRLFASDL